ncbi:MAG: ABC-2 family transporter protein [bacterium]|nr:ABC-2 family transporter protein [bacterium]
MLGFAKVGFASYLAYPAGVAMVFLSYPIIILMFRAVFGAVYDAGAETGYTREAWLTYVTVSWILNTFYMTPTGRNLGANVREGQVAMDLLKPLNLQAIYFGQSLGRTMFRLVFASIPLLIAFSFFAQLQKPRLELLIPFALTVFCGYLINFQLDYMIGLSAFFLEYNNGVRMGVRMVMNLAGGMVIPLDYLPPQVADVFRALPTQFMFFQPMQVYLGRHSVGDSWLVVATALCWVLGLLLLAQLLQWKGMQKLSISGG